MRKYTFSLLVATCLLFSGNLSFAQMVSGNAFLQGRWLEIGMLNNGSFGTTTSPAGYHPHPGTGGVTALGEVYDFGHDGWTVGSPAYMGDYTYPGSPYEGWELQVNGSQTQAFALGSSTGSYNGTLGLTGSITSYSNTGGSAVANWSGSAMSGQLVVNMQTRVDTNASWVVMTVTLNNTGGTPLNNIYFMRSNDPDNDESWAGGSFTTKNYIDFQNDAVHRVQVRATTATPSPDQYPFSLCAMDSRAVAFIYDSWPLSVTQDLAAIWNKTYGPAGTAAWYAIGTEQTGDIAIGLVFNLGNLAPGASTSFSYAYTFSGRYALDTALSSGITVNASALTDCATFYDTLTSSNTYLMTYQWQSSPDSATWSNIAGATNYQYVIPGLTTTTYYRVCAGMDTSAGIKITYIPTCCSGMPPMGTTSVSTTSCSSCSVTLSLPGYPVLAGFTFQWQNSLDNITWNNIPAGTTETYTYVPYETYYYRCLVKCVPSDDSTYSTTVEVPYDYHIVSHSITNAPDTFCNGSYFNIQVNGVSPLLAVKTYFGDGATDSVSMTSSLTSASATANHIYSWPGNYTVKQVAYWNNVPQDSIMFSYEYYYCRTLPLKFYFDLNGDCIQESTEPYNSIPVQVEVSQDGIAIDTVYVTSGLYYLESSLPGTIYGFRVIPGTFVASCTSPDVVYDTITSAAAYPIKKYGLSCGTPGFDLAVYDVIPVTGEYDQWGNVYLQNNACNPVNATVTVKYSPYYGSPDQLYPAATSVTDSTITWNVSGLSNTSGVKDLHYSIWSSGGCCGTISPGLAVQTKVFATPTAGDIDTLNNYCEIWDTVRAGCDPNEMSVTPSACLPSGAVTQLQYTVHFMNVGNDTAFNIYVMDTLSNNVDPKSITIVMASNTMNIATLQDGPYNIVKFDFPQINLLDSAACPQCSGAVIFNVNTKPGLPDGTTIFNHAGVFFDYNPVVMTNTVENIIGCSGDLVTNNVKQVSHSIQIFPNPATDELTIVLTNVTLSGAEGQLTITNSIGQTMMQQPITTSTTKINVSSLPAGLYYITFRGDNGTEVRKFVKM